MSVDRTPKPCLHKIANHEHGTYAAYVLDLCRCEPCATANRLYERNRTRQQAYGRWNGYTDAEPARQHVHALMAQGMGLKRIVAVSDVSQGVLWKLMYGKRRPDGSQIPSRRIKPETERRILAVKADLAPAIKVDSTGTRRRLQALIALGWSVGQISKRSGLDRQRLDGALHGRDVIKATRDAVTALYDELWDAPPPETNQRERIAASRSRRRAALNGWVPPLAWDDDTIDDPSATSTLADGCEELDELAVELAMAGKPVSLTAAETTEALKRMVALRLSDEQIATRLHVSSRTVLRWRQREGLESRWAA